MTDAVDVVVTDGFTGNVILKTLEGGLRVMVGAMLAVLSGNDEIEAAARIVLPALAPLAEELEPDSYGGAMLLGVDGVCIISHGSSSARAIVNAVREAHDAVDQHLVSQLRAVVTRVEHEGQHVIVTGAGELVNTVILALHGAGVEARDVQLDASNLEDAFVRLTGTHLDHEGEQS